MRVAPKASPDEVRAGRLFAVKMLDDYGFPLGVITGVLQVSEKWVQRNRERLVRRPARPTQPGEISLARQLVLVRMLREEVRVPIIMEVLGLSKDSIYRYADGMHRDLAKYPPWYRRLIAAELVNGNEPMPVRRWYTKRHASEWRTKKAAR